ncbi:hypothetical protein [Propionivibrio limicola]|uniref:hypothetical protein n=1 Tax=Propionivibrio limicola TaxID=167645 RepID=UPI0012916BEA|nr:hypothetical protein [Propionivibrio limicola]
MKKTILSVAVGLLCAAVQADPSVSLDASRQQEVNNSDKVTREKKMSIDKSNGSKATTGISRESSREKSVENKFSARRSNERKGSRDMSVQVDINSRLIQHFTMRYEVNKPPVVATTEMGVLSRGKLISGLRDMMRDPDPGMRRYAISELRALGVDVTPKMTFGKLEAVIQQNLGIVEFLGACKPFSRQQLDYPVAAPGRGFDSSWDILTVQESAQRQVWAAQPRPVLADPSDPTISRYGKCRLAAHFWISEAAELAASSPVGTEAEVDAKIVAAFEKMEADPELQDEISAKVNQVWGAASCGAWVKQANTYDGRLDMQCGVLQVMGDQVIVLGMPSLSRDSINGKRYAINVSAGTSTTSIIERATDRSDRTSASTKSTSSTESFVETKRDVHMSRNRQSDSGMNNRTQRGSQSTVSVNPRSGQ